MFLSFAVFPAAIIAGISSSVTVPILRRTPSAFDAISDASFNDLAITGLAPKERVPLDRKSTRLNSSHVAISYAVFCLKKKKKQTANAYKGNYQSTQQNAKQPSNST